MNIIFAAILPTIFLLVLGNLFRRRGFLNQDFWAASDKLTYFVLFPALLITKVSQVDLSSIDFAQVMVFVVGYFFVVSAMAFIVYRVSGTNSNQFSSIYQGVLRFNSYVYFAIIEAVWGAHALATAALIAGLCIPLVNVCCVASFAFGTGSFSLLSTLRSIIKNPLIIGALLGFLANLFPVLLPSVVFDTLAILSKAALPLALLSVGAAVQVKRLFVAHAGFSRQCLWLTTIARLMFAPCVAWLLIWLIGIDGEVKQALVLFAATSTATSSYILSKQLGGDADMMATLISLQTVLSLVSLIFWLHLLT